MPAVPESSAGPADRAVANDYDGFADAYVAETETNLVNCHYERPAILDPAGQVAGRRILGTGADLQAADLRRPPPFADGTFDDVIASLVLHYLEDWTAPPAEPRRVLRPGGRLIASVEHPFHSQLQADPGADYFATRSWSFEWTLGGYTALMTFWHRPSRRTPPANCSPPISRTARRGPSWASCSSSWMPSNHRSRAPTPRPCGAGRARRPNVGSRD